MTEATRRIIEAVRAVPRGKVCSYRDIARAAGLPNGARQVVRALHSMSEKYRLPWHRIIRADGSIALEAGRGREIQIELLRAEGVIISASGRIDMKRCGFTPASDFTQGNGFTQAKGSTRDCAPRPAGQAAPLWRQCPPGTLPPAGKGRPGK
ncbi:MAG: MGMT family protein [Treponema sp.]|nr:MGMT family protein [Treponema sp.]